MKRKYIFCCAFFIIVVLVLMSGYFKFLKPVGSIGDIKIRQYELSECAQLNKRQLFEQIADELVFETMVKNLNIRVQEEEINVQMAVVKEQFPELNEKEVYTICRKTILRQKTVEKFASEVIVDAELARKFYDENRVQYGEGEPDYEQIKSELQMEMGEKKYEEYLDKLKAEQKIRFYG